LFLPLGKYKEKLHMHINDASWATFKQLPSYKAERVGKRVLLLMQRIQLRDVATVVI
jgi:hypothetical protein